MKKIIISLLLLIPFMVKADIDKRDATIINCNDDRYTVNFYTTKGEVVSNNKSHMYDDPKIYLMDIKNGYYKSDIGFIPFDVKVELEPYEVTHFYMKCTIEDMDDFADKYREE